MPARNGGAGNGVSDETELTQVDLPGRVRYGGTWRTVWPDAQTRSTRFSETS